MTEFTVNSFLETLEKDSITKKEFNKGDWITKISMNHVENQGTIMFIPFLSKQNNFYIKIMGIKEWNGNSTKYDKGKPWYKILPNEYYHDVKSEEDISLLAEINSLFDSLQKLTKIEKNKTVPLIGYKSLRVRSYSLMYGILCSHVNINNKKLTENVNKPCLFVFPSKSPVTAIHDAVSQKNQAMNSVNWVPGIFNPNNTGREGVIMLTFKRGDPGYDSSVSFEFNTSYNNVVDSSRIFTEEETKFFKDPIRDFLGWQGNGDAGYFNTEIMTELRDDLKLQLDVILSNNQPRPEPVFENKNSMQDPMKVAVSSTATPIMTQTYPMNSTPVATTQAATTPVAANAGFPF